MLLASNISNLRFIKTVVFVFIGVASAIVALGLVQYLSPSTEAFHVRGAFGNRNVFGGYLSLILPLCFGLMLFDSSRLRRVWYGLVLAAGFAVMLSGGRLSPSCCPWGVLTMIKGPRTFVLIAVVFLGVLALAAPRLHRDNGTILYESIRLYDDNNEVSRRYTEWEAAGTMMRENPWIGVGTGRYQEYIGTY